MNVSILLKLTVLGLMLLGAPLGAQEERPVSLQEAIANVEPWQAGCSDYYRAPSGRVVTQWPYGAQTYRLLSRILGRPSETTRGLAGEQDA